MPRANTSLTRSIYVRLLLSIIVSILTIGLLWFASGYHQLRTEKHFFREQARARQMEIQKERVQSVLNLIEQERAQFQQQNIAHLRARTNGAYSVVAGIYHQVKDSLPRVQIEELVKAALRDARYNQGRGYFFALRRDGTVELYPPDPNREGQKATALQMLTDQPLTELLQKAREQGEGLYEYTWTAPQPPHRQAHKISYVKYFAPLDWIIGSGDLLTDAETALQNNLVERIEKIRFADGSYIFITNFAGVSLTYPAKDRNMYDATDQNGLKIVQEFIKLAKAGGGYLNYVMPPLKGERAEPKISYVAGIPDWQWYIGTGNFVADLDAETAQMLKAQQTDMNLKMAVIVVLLCLFLVIGGYVSRRLGKDVTACFNKFQNFFNRASHDPAPLDPTEANFAEFRALAGAANLMLEDRRHFEQEAAAYRDQLRNIIDAMPSILAAVDESGGVIQWNTYAAEHTGIDQDRASGEKIDRLLPYLGQHIEEILETCRQHKNFQQSVQVRSNGDFRSVNISAYPLSNQAPLRFVIRIDDITEQVRIEEMMVQTEKMLSVGGLAAGMAHEINNPLSIISQAAQNAQRRLSPSLPANREIAAQLEIDLTRLQDYLEQRGIYSFLQNIGQAVERSAEIVQNMLNFTSSSASEREICSLEQTVLSALELAKNDYDLKKKYNFRNIRISTSFPAELPQVIINRMEIEQVFFNLFKNAGQAMSEVKRPDFQPEIKIVATSDRKYISLEVSDNGPGIPDHIKSRILEPFFTTKEVGIGSGLGLSVAYFIVVKRHKGQFLIHSEVGQGTTFNIFLPRENEDAQ